MKRLAKLVCALMAMGAGAAAWSNEAVLAEWRMAVATNGCVGVERKVKVPSDVQQAIWKCYREHIGIEGVQMSKPKLVSTNEFVAVYDLPFTTADGAHQNFGIVMSKSKAKPLYRTSEGFEDNGNPVALNPVECVANMFLGDDKGTARIASPNRVLSVSDAIVSLGFADDVVAPPFDEYLFFFIDDCPSANWGHPARCVFVRPDLSEFAVLHVNMPARVRVGGMDVDMSLVVDNADKTVSINAETMAKSAKMSLLSETKSGYPSVTDGDASNCYALLVSGGGDARNNHGRYWNDICFCYNVLRQRYGLPRENIKVLWASGNPNADLCWKTGKCCWKTCLGANAFPSSDLCDFDQDGNNDITDAATANNLSTVLNGYATSLKSTDQLFIFVTDHGNSGANSSDDEPAVLCMWNGEISDVQFANLTKNIRCPVMVALETCYSGGMVEEFLASGKNRIIATADGFDSSEDGNHAMDVWVYNFFSALCGYYPGGTYYISSSEIAPVDVRSVGKACNADYDNDGKISFFEAAQFAVNNNPIRGDLPENHSSSANLHKKMFMTQYADVPAVVVKEKVLTPTLSPASGTLGYAPCTVTASCGTSGATIRYTTDGSTPTGKSTVYSGEITISSDTTITIRAFKSGMDASDTVQVAYSVKKSAPEKALITSVSQGDSSSGIVISWSGGSGTESYDILRSESSAMTSAKTVVSGLPVATSSYADMTAEPGKTYYYQIRSRNAYGATLSAVSQGAYLMLNPPDGVKATVTSTKVSAATVKIDWNAAAGASSYRVYRKLSDGTLTALGSWQTGRTYTDTVSLSGANTAVSYYVRSSAHSSGANPSGYSKETAITITSSTDDWRLMLNYPWHSTTDLGAICHRPGTSREYSCRLQYADGSFETSGFVVSPTWRVKNGQGITLTSANGSYNGWSYRPPTVSVVVSATAPAQTATIAASFTTAAGVAVTRDFKLFVTTVGVPKSISVSSPDFATPGETIQLEVQTSYYGYRNWDDEPWVEPEVSWTVIGGSGATLSEDGELTAWPVSSKTTVTVQACAQTPLGLITATKTLNVSPAVITKQTAIVPPLGGESTNFVGKLDTSTYCECHPTAWISGLGYHGSKTTNPTDSTIHINVGSGRNSVGIIGSYLFLSFRAARNPGKDREMPFKLRWDGGGIDFTIIQREAPYANDPVVSGGANGTITAKSTTDGSILHYATDGEEPSADSPVFSNSLSFNDSTEFAVKAFGDWMQASDTVYADVVGRDAQWDEVKITFVPVQPGLATPAKRTYKVNETFGELPSFQKTNGLYFKGWSLHEGSDKLVSANDSVPSQNATLYAVWSPVAADKPQWIALPWNFKSAMMVTMKVYDDMTGTYLDPSACIIGIEDADGLCRGSSENGFGDVHSELNGKNGLYVFGVYSQIVSGSESGLKIRVWNKQHGFMSVVDENLVYLAGENAGSENSPRIVHVMTKCVVTFDSNGGAIDELSRGVTMNSVIGDLPTPTRVGHTFKGWYTKKSGGSKIKTSTKVTKDVTYYARWTANKYKIKFSKNGGKGTMKTLSATYGKNVKLRANAFKRSKHTFQGWATTKNGAVVYKNKAKVKNLTETDGKTVTLYAVWKPYSYTVKFTANGGTGAAQMQTVKCGAKTKLAANAYVREGFEFAGWAKKKGGPVVYKNKASVKDLAKKGKTVTLYAVWKPAKWAVGTFNGEGTVGGKAATATLTVSSGGKISGKFVRTKDKNTYSFKSGGFDEYSDGALRATTTLKCGSKKCVLEIAVGQAVPDDAPGTVVTVAEMEATAGGKTYATAILRISK